MPAAVLRWVSRKKFPAFAKSFRKRYAEGNETLACARDACDNAAIPLPKSPHDRLRYWEGSMADVSVKCPQCQAKLKAPESRIGKKIKCPKCTTSFVLVRTDNPAR